MADASSLFRVDQFGRMRSWALGDVAQAAAFNARGPFSDIRCLAFIGRAGSELFTVTSLFWDVEELEAVCVRIGVPVTFGYYLTRARPVNRKLRATLFALSLASGVALWWSFYPLPQ
jgi:hypothetical protein